MKREMGKIPIQVLAKAIQLRAYYIVMQIVLGTMTAKKTREWLHGLAPATGVPTIQPSLNDFHRVPNVVCGYFWVQSMRLLGACMRLRLGACMRLLGASLRRRLGAKYAVVGCKFHNG